MLQRPVPNGVCPSLWHTPNCQLTGGHTTWGTVNFPHQMEFYLSRSRPTTGLLEQMLCRQSLDLSFLHPPCAPPSLTAREMRVELWSVRDFPTENLSPNLLFEEQSPTLQILRKSLKTEM